MKNGNGIFGIIITIIIRLELGKVTQVTFTAVTDDDFDAMSVTKYFKGG